MNTFLFRPDLMAKNYNCSSRTYEQWQSLGVPNVRLALVYGALGVLFWSSYMPFLYVFLKADLLKHSCYKIMLFLGCIDMACIPICCFFVAYGTAYGLLYCMSPRLIYVAGSGGLSLWCAGSTTCMLLGFNRCVDMVSPSLAEKLFKGKRTLLWLLIPTAYFLYFFFFHTSMCFSSILYTIFFDPFVGMPERNGTVDNVNYPHMEHSTHNFVVIAVMGSCYSILCINLFFKARNSSVIKVTKLQRNTILQSLVICSPTFAASLLAIYVQFVAPPMWLVITGQIFWQSSHGIVGLTYLTFNSTLRQAAKKLWCSVPVQPHTASTNLSNRPTT